MDYCEKEKIPLTLIGAPMPDFLLAGVGNYDAYISRIRELIRERDVDYYDFNLCRPEYFPQDIHLFKDTDHVNCYGAETFSRTFASLVNGDVSPEEMFYGSYQEKMERTGQDGWAKWDGRTKHFAALPHSGGRGGTF